MANKTYVYDDPTGGGDDITLTMPEWAHAPIELMVRGVADGEPYYFERGEEVEN